jgi:hypothetical protein
MKAAMLAQGALGINEPKPEEFKTPEDLQQAKNYYGPAAIAGVLLGGPGAMGAVEKGVSALRGAEDAASAVKGIKAFHGSPADFEAFSAEKIGTGEGGRLLGHGHNFTEREARAAQYKPEGGHMYEVNINAPPEHFLNWDVPMNEQSPHVQAAVERLPVEYMPSLVPRDAKGGELMHAMSKNVGAQEGEGFFTKGPHPDVSKELKDAGIVGTVGGTPGTRDYVVYPGNEHLIEIMKKYGVTLPVAAEIYRRQQAQAHDPGAESSTPFTLSK